MHSKEIVIVYENVVREYDNALLLKAELVKRGYKVKIVYKMDLLWKRRNNAVLVMPNGYNDEDIKAYKYFANVKNGKYISLQYEQVFSKKIEDAGVHIPKGEASNINLFCWGKNCYKRLKKAGIAEENLKICGALHFDFLRDEFSEFYLSRKEIAQKYNLDENKKWFLYVSSFTYVNNPVLLQYTKEEIDNDFINDFVAISVKSHKITLEWMDELLKNNQDMIVIYRKHPVEFGNDSLDELLKKYPKRFRDIGELGVKQWIKVVDIAATWISTVATEVYAAGKSILIIRPYPIPSDLDMPVYFGADYIDSYEKLQLKVDTYEKDGGTAFVKEVVDNYYLVDETPAYIKTADEIEKIAKQKKVEKELFYSLNRCIFLWKRNIVLKYFVKKIYQFFYFHFRIQIKSKKLREKFCVVEWEKMAKHYKDKLNEEKYKKLEEVVNRR